MSSSDDPQEKGSGIFGAGSAALLKVMSNPLGLSKPRQTMVETDENGALSRDSINAIIETEIIPRLLMAHGPGEGAPLSRRTNGATRINSSSANRFALLPLSVEVAGLIDEVEVFIEEGVSVEAIYLDLLAPAARKLGEMWETDECDFVDVTMGLWRLQEVMRELSTRMPVLPGTIHLNASRALFAPMPGDEHSFGAVMLDEVFARAGWSSEVITKPLRKELLDAVSKEAFDVVGLTLSRDCPSAAVKNIIRAMRSVSRNPNLSILIGGHMINQNPAIVAEVGADGTGADARAALQVANALVQSAEVRANRLR